MMVIIKHIAGEDTLLQILKNISKLSYNKLKQLQKLYINYDTPYYIIIINPICYSIWSVLPAHIDEIRKKLIVTTVINVLKSHNYTNYGCSCITNTINCFVRYFQSAIHFIDTGSIKVNFRIPKDKKFSACGYEYMVKNISEKTIDMLNMLINLYEEENLKKPIPRKKERSDKIAEKYADKILSEIYPNDPYSTRPYSYLKDN